MDGHNSNLNNAMRYADSGFFVLPCVPKAKKPLTEHGCHDATDDHEQIIAWWSATPSANVGIATAGLCVVDFDCDYRHSEWYASLTPPQQEELLSAPRVSTPGGGVHIYFRDPIGSIRCSTSKLGPSVDISGVGGLVVAPPSYTVVSKPDRNYRGQYKWVNCCDVELTDLSPVPDWLRVMIADLGKNKNQNNNADNSNKNIIPSGQRNSTLASLAGRVRSQGFNTDEITPLLLQANRKRCRPPLPDDEVMRIAESVGKYDAPGLVTAPRRRLSVISSADFSSAQYPQTYIVDGVLCEGQNCLLGGRSKSLKTSVGIDLAVSLGTATPFMNKFYVKEKRRVAVLSGESGEATIQETARRVCSSKGIELRDADCLWGFTLPKIGEADDLRQLRQLIMDHEIDVVMIDPVYLCLLDEDSAAMASNVLAMGARLSRITEAVAETGVTVVMIHHSKKSITHGRYDPMELEDLAQAGFAEWARQWILLARRDEYEQGTGDHKLWMNVGGSAGHNSLWGLDITEGHPDLYGGRYWSVDVMPGGELRKEQRSQADTKKQAKQDEALLLRQNKIVEVLECYPDGLTPSAITAKSGVGHRSGLHAIESLLIDGAIIECEVMVSNHKTKKLGYKLPNVNHSEHSDEHSDACRSAAL